jgi:hypothetical protein
MRPRDPQRPTASTILSRKPICGNVRVTWLDGDSDVHCETC